MKAVRLLEYGGSLVFNDVPTPTIARDEVLVKIRSTAVNHLDLVEASGTARQILPIELPWIPGHEFSGVVEQIGSDVATYAPGDAVFGTTTGMGAYAEYLAVKAAAIARKPSNLSFEEAASVPVASQTAWQGIFTHAHLEKGQTILIHGGAGAVGAYAVQLASHAGAIVVATASGNDEAFLKSIGASRVIDYREAQFEKVLGEKVDVVFDLVRGDMQKSYLVLKEGGHLVSAVQPVSPEEAARHRVSGMMMRLAPSGDVLGRIGRLLEEGTIRPEVATVYALEDVAQAWNDIAGNLPGVHGMSPVGREGQDASHTARSCFVSPRYLPRVAYVLAFGGALVKTRRRGTKRKTIKLAQGRVARGIQPEMENTMSTSISTLLLRNLKDVFGENDPVRRRGAIDEIFHEDAVFYDPKGGEFRGRDEIHRIAGVIKATHPDFEYQPLFPPEEVGDAGRVRWVSGSPGKAPAYAGTDFIVVRNGQIASVYLFFDNLPPRDGD